MTYEKVRRAPASDRPVFFASALEFRSWLQANGAEASALLVGFYKVGSGKPSITWPESVDEALCVGWIDGVRKRIDDEAYTIRFAPRKKDSIWSTVNIARAEALIAQGRMQLSGQAAYGRRTERRSGVYSYEQRGLSTMSPDEVRVFRKNKIAWKQFEGAPASYRKTITHWVVSAKRQDTRARRLARLIESCAAGLRLLP